MQTPEQYSTAEELERHLGDPLDPERVFCFRRSLELDEAEEYPEEATRLLEEWGLSQYFIPAESGGRLRSYEELLALLRVVSRRDLTAAIGYAKTYLGAVTTWVGGTPQQRRRVARIISNGEQVALGLTEREHGSDLLSAEVSARETAGGYVIDGEKWLINNATRGTALTVFARTDEAGGPRGFSLFLVEKRAVAAGSYTHLPKIKTHGIRGADISGIRFRGCEVAEGALVGGRGAGLELTLRSLQVTRTIVPALSLGAADTALRCTLDFALGRRLYGASVFDIPHARRTLVDAFVDILICDCVATAAARGLHFAPEQMSVWSAVTKYLVPTLAEGVVKRLSVILGARHYLRDGHWWGVFQKVLRDNALAGLFDGSTIVNLNAIALQLRHLSKGRAAGREAEKARALVESVFTLARPVPELDPAELTIFNRGQDCVMQALRDSAAGLDGLKGEPGVDDGVLASLTSLAGELVLRLKEHDRSLEDLLNAGGQAFGKSPETFELAKDYCLIHAAASCLHTWLHNRQAFAPFFARGEWLALALERLLYSLGGRRAAPQGNYAEGAAEELSELFREDKLFSIVPLQLAGQGR